MKNKCHFWKQRNAADAASVLDAACFYRSQKTFQLYEVHLCCNHIIESCRESSALASCSSLSSLYSKTPLVKKLPQLQYLSIFLFLNISTIDTIVVYITPNTNPTWCNFCSTQHFSRL